MTASIEVPDITSKNGNVKSDTVPEAELYRSATDLYNWTDYFEQIQ